MPYLMTLLVAISAAAMTLLYVMWTRRRRTPRLHLDPDTIPPVAELLPTLSGLTGGMVHKGNSADVLHNGQLFPSMLRDIGDARTSVHLETFVWSAGELERRFVQALAAKAGQGITVRVLVDAIGASKADVGRLDSLRASGAKVAVYRPPRPWNWRRLNHRTHRKLLIVDGRIGYTFGHGIADEWLGDAEDEDHWRDTGIRAEGPVVHGLQAVFAENWVEESKEFLVGDSCFPELAQTGDTDAYVVSSASGDELSKVAIAYTVAIAAATREVLIQNPYFAPDRGVVDLLKLMVKREVEIHLMVPGGKTDSPFVRRAGCYLYEALMRAGVRIYEYGRTLNHQKIMIVDGVWSHVGSTNFDARSLELNEEISVGLIDEGIAAELKQAFERDLQYCRELSLGQWRARSRRVRIVENVAFQLHKQL